jgi:Flp pilus assembly protein TadD
MAACRRLLTIDPNNWQAHYLLALGLEAVGEGAAAATHARAAVDLQPPYALERAAAQALVERLTADRP